MVFNPADKVQIIQITPSKRLRFRKFEPHTTSGSRTYVCKQGKEIGDAIIPTFPGEPSGLVINSAPRKHRTWQEFLGEQPPKELIPVKVSNFTRIISGRSPYFGLFSSSVPWPQKRDAGAKRPYITAFHSYDEACGAAFLEGGLASAQRNSSGTLNEKITILLGGVVLFAVLITGIMMWPTISQQFKGIIPHIGTQTTATK